LNPSIEKASLMLRLMIMAHTLRAHKLPVCKSVAFVTTANSPVPRTPDGTAYHPQEKKIKYESIY
jgi:hypothetical protein